MTIPLAIQCMSQAKQVATKVAQEVAASSKILGLAMGATTAYGIAHHQIAVRVDPTLLDDWRKKVIIAKNIIESTKSPTIVALIAGAPSALGGVIFGIPVTAAARIGNWPKLCASDFVKPAVIAFTGIGLVSLLSGIWGYYCKEKTRSNCQCEKNRCRCLMPGFNAVNCAHNAAQISGRCAALGLASYALIKRYSIKY